LLEPKFQHLESFIKKTASTRKAPLYLVNNPSMVKSQFKHK